MLAGVKSQVASSVGGWLSGATGAIPGLNRGATETDPNQQQQSGVESTDQTSRDPTESATEHVKDDDASRWVEGYVKAAASRTPRSSCLRRPEQLRTILRTTSFLLFILSFSLFSLNFFFFYI